METQNCPWCRIYYEALVDLRKAISTLMAESEGVDGLHLNGDVAPWHSLLSGGEFEDWLGPAMDKANRAIEAATRKER